MNRYQLLTSLRKTSTQRRNRRANQKVWENLVDPSTPGYERNRNYNALLKDFRNSSLPFI